MKEMFRHVAIRHQNFQIDINGKKRRAYYFTRKETTSRVFLQN